jgi:hypothetical protein
MAGNGRHSNIRRNLGLDTAYAIKPLTGHKILIASVVVFSYSFCFGNSKTTRRSMTDCVAYRLVLALCFHVILID